MTDDDIARLRELAERVIEASRQSLLHLHDDVLREAHASAVMLLDYATQPAAIIALIDRLREAERERDALLADARRYRWLRAGVVGVSAGVDEDGSVIYHARCRRLTQMLRVPSASPTNAEIDAAIDRTAGRPA